MQHDDLAIALWDALLRSGDQEAIGHFAEVQARIELLTENFDEIEKPIRYYGHVGKAIHGKSGDRDEEFKKLRKIMNELPPRHLAARVTLGALLCGPDRINGHLGAGSAARLFTYLQESR